MFWDWYLKWLSSKKVLEWQKNIFE
jgi:hypothetical protein